MVRVRLSENARVGASAEAKRSTFGPDRIEIWLWISSALCMPLAAHRRIVVYPEGSHGRGLRRRVEDMPRARYLHPVGAWQNENA
jgi:hypothetical protein